MAARTACVLLTMPTTTEPCLTASCAYSTWKMRPCGELDPLAPAQLSRQAAHVQGHRIIVVVVSEHGGGSTIVGSSHGGRSARRADGRNPLEEAVVVGERKGKRRARWEGRDWIAVFGGVVKASLTYESSGAVAPSKRMVQASPADLLTVLRYTDSGIMHHSSRCLTGF